MVVGLAAVWAVYHFMPKTPKDQTEEIVVAARRIEIGTPLAAADVKVAKWPRQNTQAIRDLHEVIYAKVDDVIDKYVGATLDPGDPIKQSKLEFGAIPPPIRPGYRAMAVSVNEVIDVAGYAQPDTYVDVIVTERTGTDRASHIILKGIRVLSAGTKAQQLTINKIKEQERDARANNQAPKDRPPVPSTVVTLEVVPDDAEKLALAQNDGNITLALRRNDEKTGGPDTKKKTWTDLMGAAPRAEQAAPPRVTIYAGTKSTSQEVKR